MCLLAGPWVQLSVSAGNGWPHNALRHHWLMPISCHFRDCKALLVTSLTHVSGTIASAQIFTFITVTVAHFNSLYLSHKICLFFADIKKVDDVPDATTVGGLPSKYSICRFLIRLVQYDVVDQLI